MDLEQIMCCIGYEILISCHKNACHSLGCMLSLETAMCHNLLEEKRTAAGNLSKSPTGSSNASTCLERAQCWQRRQ